MRPINTSCSQIYEFYYDLELTTEIYQKLISSEIKWRQYHHSPNETKLSVNNDNNYFYDELLFSWVERCINQVGSTHFPNLKFSISDSWVSKTEFNDKLRKHKHSNSILSAVFYCRDEKTNINFFLPDPVAAKYELLLSKNSIKEQIISINPKKGQLLIFDSTLYHNVEKHLDIEPRYSVVFNSFFSGKLNVHTNGITEDTDRLELEVKTQKNR
jgi:hypothetical protein